MSKLPEGEQRVAGIEGKPVQLVWGLADDLPTVYANHLYITHAGQNEFYLVFGELGPQAGLDVDNPPDHIEIKPVAKIAVSPPNMLRMAEAIMDNVGKFKEKSLTRKEGDEQ